MASSESVIVPPILKKIYGVNINKKYRLLKSKIVIGRNPDSDIKLDSLVVSRKHCIIRFRDGKWLISNHSLNGTFVNGRSIEADHILNCGDIIFLGPPSETPEAFTFDDIPDEEPSQDQEELFPTSTNPSVIPAASGSSSDPEILCPSESENRQINLGIMDIKKRKRPDSPMTRKPSLSPLFCQKEIQTDDFYKEPKLDSQLDQKPDANRVELVQAVEQVDSIRRAHQKLIKDFENEREKNKILQEQLLEQKESFKARLERLACNICTELVMQPVVLDCSHAYCEHCIKEWRKRKAQCPLCRQPIKSSTRVLILDEFINESLEALAPVEKERRKQVLREREAAKLPKPRPRSKKGRRRRPGLVAARTPLFHGINQWNIQPERSNNIPSRVRNIEVVDLSPAPCPPGLITLLGNSSSDSENDVDLVEEIDNYCYNCGNFGHSAANCM